MHININKDILAHPFLSTDLKLSSQFKCVGRKKIKELFSCFPFRRINAAPLRVQANFRHFSPSLFTFSHFGGHTENIFLPTKLSRRRNLPLTRQGARSAQQEQDMIMNIITEKNDRHPIEATIYLHI